MHRDLPAVLAAAHGLLAAGFAVSVHTLSPTADLDEVVDRLDLLARRHAPKSLRTNPVSREDDHFESR